MELLYAFLSENQLEIVDCGISNNTLPTVWLTDNEITF